MLLLITLIGGFIIGGSVVLEDGQGVLVGCALSAPGYLIGCRNIIAQFWREIIQPLIHKKNETEKSLCELKATMQAFTAALSELPTTTRNKSTGR